MNENYDVIDTGDYAVDFQTTKKNDGHAKYVVYGVLGGFVAAGAAIIGMLKLTQERRDRRQYNLFRKWDEEKTQQKEEVTEE